MARYAEETLKAIFKQIRGCSGGAANQVTGKTQKKIIQVYMKKRIFLCF